MASSLDESERWRKLIPHAGSQPHHQLSHLRMSDWRFTTWGARFRFESLVAAAAIAVIMRVGGRRGSCWMTRHAAIDVVVLARSN
jgi:hypothetical protein